MVAALGLEMLQTVAEDSAAGAVSVEEIQALQHLGAKVCRSGH